MCQHHRWSTFAKLSPTLSQPITQSLINFPTIKCRKTKHEAININYRSKLSMRKFSNFSDLNRAWLAARRREIVQHLKRIKNLWKLFFPWNIVCLCWRDLRKTFQIFSTIELEKVSWKLSFNTFELYLILNALRKLLELLFIHPFVEKLLSEAFLGLHN